MGCDCESECGLALTLPTASPVQHLTATPPCHPSPLPPRPPHPCSTATLTVTPHSHLPAFASSQHPPPERAPASGEPPPRPRRDPRDARGRWATGPGRRITRPPAKGLPATRGPHHAVRDDAGEGSRAREGRGGVGDLRSHCERVRGGVRGERGGAGRGAGCRRGDRRGKGLESGWPRARVRGAGVPVECGGGLRGWRTYIGGERGRERVGCGVSSKCWGWVPGSGCGSVVG